jgi:uncharacterized membrane protein YeaQ/YmgE (transglycosylase-associated protein family)
MHLSGIIGIIFDGLIIGALGRLILPGRQPIGCVMTVLLGVVGGVAGWYLGHDAAEVGDGLTFLIQVVCAAALVGLFGLIFRGAYRGPPR